MQIPCSIVSEKKNYVINLSVHKLNHMMSRYKTLINITGNAYVSFVNYKNRIF